MRLFALIGIILLLVLPFSYVRTTVESDFLGETTTTSMYGLLYWRTTSDSGLIKDQTESFQANWLEEDKEYDLYFGDLRLIGLLVLLVLFVGLGLAIKETDTNNSTSILVVSGILLLLLRFLELSDRETSFYDQFEVISATTTIIEIPVGFILSVIFGILDFKKS